MEEEMEVEIDGIEEREEEREEIYSYLKCKICDGYFENAKILPSCFHSFCLVCISQSAECLTQENHFSIACEICNTITTTPSLSLLPNNSISEKLLKNFNPKNLQQNKVLSHSIEYCDNEICKKENKKASLYCDKCEANYCEECWKVVHSFGGIQKHSPLPILQKNNIKYCSTHLHKQMKFYCVPCDQLLCSLCFLDNHYINDRISKNHLVEPIDKAGEDIKKRMIKTSDQIALNRSSLDNRINEYEKKRNEINQSINEKKNNIQNLLREIELVKDDIEKLEIEKEIIKKKIKEDEENSTQIEISNRMIKDMIQSLPSILTTQKKYRDQIDHQISRVFESLYSFPLPQIDDLYILTDQEREECPTPQCQKEIMKKLEMKRPPLREGDVWYLIEYGWHQKWKRHVKYDWIYDINISPPDLIDNSNLLLPGTEILKQAVFENQDFIVSTYKEWKQLVSWYGGGPAIPRIVIATGASKSVITIEYRKLEIRVLKSSDLNTELNCMYSKVDSVKKLVEEMAPKLGVDPKNIRVWDYHGGTKTQLLMNLDLSLFDARIINGQQILFEETNEDGLR